MIICLCRGVSDRQIYRAIREGARTLEDVGIACAAGTSCGSCHTSILAMIGSFHSDEIPAVALAGVTAAGGGVHEGRTPHHRSAE